MYFNGGNKPLNPKTRAAHAKEWREMRKANSKRARAAFVLYRQYIRDMMELMEP